MAHFKVFSHPLSPESVETCFAAVGIILNEFLISGIESNEDLERIGHFLRRTSIKSPFQRSFSKPTFQSRLSQVRFDLGSISRPEGRSSKRWQRLARPSMKKQETITVLFLLLLFLLPITFLTKMKRVSWVEEASAALTLSFFTHTHIIYLPV